MTPFSFIAANWQKALPPLVVLGVAAWITLFRDDPLTDRALFAALLVIYFVHQTEEHLWPGGFRQFCDAHIFHSGNDNWPVDMAGTALINIAYVWLPVGLAVLLPQTLRWIGFGWVGLTLINGIIHVVAGIRLRIYNPGLVTGLLLFIPFTGFVLGHEVAAGALSGIEVAAIVLLGIVLHIPAGGPFVWRYLHRRRAEA